MTLDILEFRKTREGAPPNPQVMIAGMVGCVLMGFAAATQYVAYRFGYHSNLGPALYTPSSSAPAAGLGIAVLLASGGAACLRSKSTRRAGPALLWLGIIVAVCARGPVYAPMRVVQWAIAFSRATAGAPEQWTALQPIFDGAYPVGLTWAVLTAAAMTFLAFDGRTKHASNAHGTAEFGSGDDLKLDVREVRRRQERRRAGRRVVEPGFMIGRQPSTKAKWPRRRATPGNLLWYQGGSHLLTVAPSGAGKGLGVVIPTLLRYPGSVVCLDLKGENFAVTHRQRIADSGEVFVLDPFRVTGDHAFHAYLNPLDQIDTRGPRWKRALADCKSLAEMLVEEGGKENKHFTDEGRSLLAVFMLHVCHEHEGNPSERTLLKVRELLTLPEEGFNDLLDRMSESDHNLVRRGVARLRQKEERERTGVISTAQIAIDFLDTPLMEDVLAPPLGSALDPDCPAGRPRQIDLRNIKGEVPMTIYIVMEPEMLKTHAGLVRMLFTCVINMAQRIRGWPPHRILMMLDEFAQLGYMRPVVEGISLVRGYGIAFWVIVQDLAQLKGKYKDEWETIFANCHVKQCFGTDDMTTAKLWSEMLGETTVFTEGSSSGSNRSFGKSSGRSTNFGESVSEKGRRLLFASEILALAQSKQLVFVRGSKPLLIDKIDYRQDPEFAGQFDSNPMYA